MALTKAANRMMNGAPINVIEFGAVGDGVADDTVAIQAAIDSIDTSGGIVFFPIGTYKTTAPITLHDLSNPSSIGENINLVGADKELSIIKGVHTGAAVVSFKGERHCSIRDLRLEGDTTTTPKTGLLLGRATASSAGTHYFESMSITGYFSAAALYSIASEENQFNHCYFSLSGGGAKYTIYTSQSDSLSVDSLTGSSNVMAGFYQCQILNTCPETDQAALYMQTGSSTSLWKFDSCFFVASDNAYVVIDTGTVSGTDCKGPIIFSNCGAETPSGSAVEYGMLLTSNGTFTLSNLVFDMTAFDGVTAAPIYAEDNLTLKNFRTDSRVGTGKDISLFNLVDSDVYWTPGDITIRGYSLGNTISYDNANTLTITGTTIGDNIKVSGGLGNGYITYVKPATASFALSKTENLGTMVTNAGAPGTVTHTLPAATLGQNYTFVRVATQVIRVEPNGTEKFRGGAAGKYISLDSDGAVVQMFCAVAGVWDILSSGTISYEP
jgi:hypothetical protein